MRVKPIIFSGPMVRAILDGKKTQTRRVLKVQPTALHVRPHGVCGNGRASFTLCEPGGANYTQFVDVGYCVGDILWVREAAYFAPNRCAYAADNPPLGRGERVKGWGRMTPSIHMPRWASRLTLEMTEVRVQRLQDISPEDALAEGVTKIRDGCYVIKGFDYDLAGLCHTSPVTPFAKLWDSINEKRGLGWEDNPWVCAITFQPHQMNADEFLARRRAV
jgi:hypothetical protein